MKLSILLISLLAVVLAQESSVPVTEIEAENAKEKKMSATSETRDEIPDKEKPAKTKLTREEMVARAAQLDKEEVFFLSHDEFAKSVSKDTWLVFFGAKWCKFCQRMTPKWVKLQDRVADKITPEFKFRVAKVDCTEDEQFCGQYGVDAYPTIILYNKGKPVEEYSSDTDLKSLYEYSKAMARRYYRYHDVSEHDEL
jgi:thioredoxin-like negative regulator of GroEL